MEPKNTEPNNMDPEEFIEMGYDTPHEDIAAAFNALGAVDGMDEAVQSNQDKIRMRQIKRWALRIIHSSLKEIYDMKFQEAQENRSSQEDE